MILALRRWTSVSLACAALLIGLHARALANGTTSRFDVRDQAVVVIWAQAHGAVEVKTWDRPSVQVESDDQNLQISRRALEYGTPENPLGVTIPVANIRVQDAFGMPLGAILPSEDFPFAADMRLGVHDTIRLSAAPNSHTVVTIPLSSALVATRIVGSGRVSISNVRGGTIIALQDAGRTTLTNVQSETYVQNLGGHVIATDSNFPRLRIRGNAVAVLMQRCRVKQIEATTYSGPIIFDDGSFDGGLARFESTTGSIAIGTSANVTFAGRTLEGHVGGLGEHRFHFDRRTENDATATVGSNGPLVSAVTTRGDVLFFEGAIGAKKTIATQWEQVLATFQVRPTPAPPNSTIGAQRAP